MGDFAQAQDFNRVTITPASPECIQGELAAGGLQTNVQGTWPAANRAIFVPFVVYNPLTVVKMFTLNGGTASGNIDIGIYDTGQNRLVSMGSTAQAGTNSIQSFDITDTLLEPGVYYMALSQSGTVGTFLRAAPGIAVCSSMGILSQSLGSVALPNPATFAAALDSYVPMFGLTARTVV